MPGVCYLLDFFGVIQMISLRTLFLTIATFLFVVPAFSQGRKDRFISGYFGFEIGLPATPTTSAEENFTLLDYSVYGNSIMWDEGTKQLATLSVYRPFKPMRWTVRDTDKAALVAEYKKGFLAKLKEHELMTSEAPYTFQGFKGVEIRGISSTRLVARLFFVGNRLYLLTAAGESGFDQQAKVLDSFRLLTKPETIAALKDEHEPITPPHGPSVKRPLSDVQGDMLKGRVKSVVEEIQESPTAGREMYREKYYDDAGNMVRDVSYGMGYPQEVTLWGWFEGKRVSSTNQILYETEDEPKGLPRSLGVRTGLMGQQEKDKAYGALHEFNYDDKNRITEWRSFSADGSLRFTYKFTHTGAGREIYVSDNAGGFLSRSSEAIDKEGNVIEYRILDMSGGRVSTTRYTYEFDAAGNWTVRKTHGGGPLVKTRGQKQGPVVYRKITYYETPKTQ